MWRPFVARCSSHAETAVSIGLRGNARATDVPSVTWLVCWLATARFWNGSPVDSATNSPSKPPCSAWRPRPGISSSAGR